MSKNIDICCTKKNLKNIYRKESLGTATKTGLDAIMILNYKKFSMFPNLYNSCLRGIHNVYRNILENRVCLNLFKVFLCITHIDVFILPNTT